VQRRLALSYAAIFSITLLLLGPVLYLSFSSQMASAFDKALRLAAQRHAALALIPTGFTVGLSNKPFNTSPSLAQRGTFYLLLSPTGRLRSNPGHVGHAGIPDESAAQLATHLRVGVFSTVATAEVGAIRLFTVPILRGHRVVALLQAGRSLTTLAADRGGFLLLLLELGSAAVVAATVGGLLLTRQAMRPINAAFAAQRAFVADASHELRTPVTLVRTNAEVLLETGAVPTPEDRALVEDIVAVSGRMGRLITDLITLARLDAGALPLAHRPVALDAVLATGCGQMARLAERHAVDLRRGPTTSLLVQGDAGRLEQVVVILLDNALTYNRRGGTVVVTLCRAGDQAVLEVRDTGPGIPAADLPHLFERFYRGRGAGVAAEGSGLGLAIASGIVRAHRGRLHVHSEPGVGSRFSVLLPLAPNTDAPQIRAVRGPAEAYERQTREEAK
jgi:signal transduction histidine kinase